MKLGLCEKDLRDSLDGNLAWMAAHGFQGVQLWKQRADRDGLSVREVGAMVADHGLEISALGGGPNMVDPAGAAAAIAAFKGIFDFAAELGCRIVSAESKSKPPDLGQDEAWASTVATMKMICAHAEALGAVLAIECAGPCFIRDHDMWLDLAQRVGSPALKVNYDPANIVWAGRDPVEGVRALAAHIVHTHAKDIARVLDEGREHLQDVPAGEGLVGYETYLRALKEIGYVGYLTIEMHAGADGRPDDILRAAANLRRLGAFD